MRRSGSTFVDAHDGACGFSQYTSHACQKHKVVPFQVFSSPPITVCDGGGQNRLGAALMLVRAELLAENGAPTHGWPEGVPRPAWVAGTAVAAVAEATDGWQRVVKRVAAQLAARLHEVCSRLISDCESA